MTIDNEKAIKILYQIEEYCSNRENCTECIFKNLCGKIFGYSTAPAKWTINFKAIKPTDEHIIDYKRATEILAKIKEYCCNIQCIKCPLNLECSRLLKIDKTNPTCWDIKTTKPKGNGVVKMKIFKIDSRSESGTYFQPYLQEILVLANTKEEALKLATEKYGDEWVCNVTINNVEELEEITNEPSCIYVRYDQDY